MIAISRSISCAALLAAGATLCAAAGPHAAETQTLEDGTRCTVIESDASAGAATGLSTEVTAGGGKVSSSTTLSQGSGAGSSSSSSATSSTGGTGSISSTSTTRPDGSVVTRRSDGTCEITRPAR